MKEVAIVLCFRVQRGASSVGEGSTVFRYRCKEGELVLVVTLLLPCLVLLFVVIVVVVDVASSFSSSFSSSAPSPPPLPPPLSSFLSHVSTLKVNEFSCA